MRVSIHQTVALLMGVCVGSLHAQRPAEGTGWTGTVGVLGMLVPAYEGAAEWRLLPLPLVQLSFRNRVYLGPNASGRGGVVGASLVRSTGRAIALEVAIGDGRPSSRSEALAGMSDRDVVGSVGVRTDYYFRGIDAALTVRQGLSGGAGALLDARVGASRRFGRMMMRTHLAATVADDRDMHRSFGVTLDEATRRQSLISSGDTRLRSGDGLAFRPNGGLKQVGLSAFLGYAVTRQWAVVGLGTVNRLGDEALRSPLVRRRTQFSVGVGLGRQVHWGSHSADR